MDDIRAAIESGFEALSEKQDGAALQLAGALDDLASHVGAIEGQTKRLGSLVENQVSVNKLTMSISLHLYLAACVLVQYVKCKNMEKQA